MSEVLNQLATLLEVPPPSIHVAPCAPLKGGLAVGDNHTFLVETRGSGASASVLSGVRALKGVSLTMTQQVIPLLVVPFMGEAGRRLCEEERVAWLDLSGNAHIIAPGMRIHIEGRQNRFLKLGRPANVFSPKSARIARVLLIHSGRLWSQRELARAAVLDEGFTSRIVKTLIGQELIAREEIGSLRVRDPAALLDAWHEVYDFSRHDILRGHVAARTSEATLQHLVEVFTQRSVDHAVTGLAAAWLMTHFAAFRIVSVFLAEPPSADLLAEVGFREEASGSNVWLVVPNDEGVFQGSELRDGIRCVHPVQGYLDLKGHPERAAEAATQLRKELLGWRADG
jgi:hypothetical protein